MTWVIGTPTIFGYSVGLADIQATLKYSNGKEEYFDSVQKIYPVGKFLFTGFSGSIELGFILIEDLKELLALPEDGSAWIPGYVVMKLTKRARRLFSLNKNRIKSGVSLLLIGVHPSKDNGIPGQPMTFGCIMRSPNFEPKYITPGNIGSIGSGNDILKYKEAIEKLNTPFNDLMPMEIGNPGMYGQALALALTLGVADAPVPGISKHFHIAIVKRGDFLFGSNNRTMTTAEGVQAPFEMPPVASSWKEFKEIMKNLQPNFNSAEAIA